MLSIANRANVSFYTVDAHGLMTTSTNQAAMEHVESPPPKAPVSQATNPGKMALSTQTRQTS